MLSNMVCAITVFLAINPIITIIIVNFIVFFIIINMVLNDDTFPLYNSDN